MTEKEKLAECIMYTINQLGGAEQALKAAQSTSAPRKMRKGRKLMMKYLRRYIYYQNHGVSRKE